MPPEGGPRTRHFLEDYTRRPDLLLAMQFLVFIKRSGHIVPEQLQKKMIMYSWQDTWIPDSKNLTKYANTAFELALDQCKGKARQHDPV